MTAGLETFAKVRALHDRTDNPGEKAAAAGRMEILARAAGMTVKQAASKLDTSAPKAAAGPSFADIFDTPFFRQAKADGDRRRAEKWREVLAEYGSEEAVFSPGSWEQALDAAQVRFGRHPGWDAFPLSKVPPEIVATIKAAYPMPVTVREAWAEFAFWDKLARDREARGVAYGDPSPPVQIRCRLLERALDTMPAAGLADLRARMDWMDWRNDLETAPDPDEERIRLATLRADIERMGTRLRDQDAEPVHNGHEGHAEQHTPASVQTGHEQGSASGAYPSRRTNAEKRAAVIALLNAEDSGTGALTDREIARRAGVSPQTVGNLRRAMT